VIPRRAVAFVAALALLPAILGSVAPSASTTADASKSRIAGMGFYTESQPLLGAMLDMGRIAKLGINTVLIDMWWNIPDGSDTVKRELVRTIDDNLVRLAIRQARSKGMQAALMPKFSVGSAHDWRGRYVPNNDAEFWASYRNMVNHYADLGRSEGASLLFVGSELAALDTRVAEWRRVIAEARSRFPGRISYNENQDATHPSRITWWDAVDIVSTTGYFPLTPQKSPTVADLVEGWKQSGLPKLIDMAAKTGKPVMIGEVGYMATEYVGRYPFANTSNQAYSPELQLRAYQALLQTLHQYRWYAGEFWWSWNGNDFRTPRDKPAEDLLKAWYKFGWRPDGSSTPPFNGFPLPLPRPLPQIP
jgi:hypothetical protein